jgi:hypothetical protein
MNKFSSWIIIIQVVNIEAHSISDPYTKHYRRHLNIGQNDPIMSVSVCVVSQNGTAFSTLSTVT